MRIAACLVLLLVVAGGAWAQPNTELAALFADTPSGPATEELRLGLSDFSCLTFKLEGSKPIKPGELSYLPLPSGGFGHLEWTTISTQHLLSKEGKELLTLTQKPGETPAAFAVRFAAAKAALAKKKPLPAGTRTETQNEREERVVFTMEAPKGHALAPTDKEIPERDVGQLYSYIGPRAMSYRVRESRPSATGRQTMMTASSALPAALAGSAEEGLAQRLIDSALYKAQGPNSTATHHGRIVFLLERDSCGDAVFAKGRFSGVCDSLRRGLYNRATVREMVGYEREGYEEGRPLRELVGYLFVHTRGRVQLVAVPPPGKPLTVAAEVGPAPEALFPGNARPIPYAALEKALPGLEDIYLSPSRRYALAVQGAPRRVVVYELATGAELGASLLPVGREVIMADWR